MKPIQKLIKNNQLRFDPKKEPVTTGVSYTKDKDGHIKDVVGFVDLPLIFDEEIARKAMTENDHFEAEVIDPNTIFNNMWLRVVEDHVITLEVEILNRERRRIFAASLYPTRGEAYWQVFFDLNDMVKDAWNQSLSVLLGMAADYADEWAKQNHATPGFEREGIYDL